MTIGAVVGPMNGLAGSIEDQITIPYGCPGSVKLEIVWDFCLSLFPSVYVLLCSSVFRMGFQKDFVAKAAVGEISEEETYDEGVDEEFDPIRGGPLACHPGMSACFAWRACCD
jgi:hypothetical protein